MSAGLSARRRVELALPAAMLHRVVASLIEGDVAARDVERFDDHPQAPVAGLLLSAWLEPLAGLPAEDFRKLNARVIRVRNGLFADLSERPIVTVYVATVKFVQRLVDDGILVAGDGAFREAWEAFATAVTDDPRTDALVGEVDRSARKLADRFFQHLRRDGYYPPPSATPPVRRLEFQGVDDGRFQSGL